MFIQWRKRRLCDFGAFASGARQAPSQTLGESKTAENIYKLIFCIMVIVGSAVSSSSVFNFGDAMIFAMCFPNVLGLYFIAPEVKKDLMDYFARIKSGEIKKFS